MKAFVRTEYGPPSVLHLEEVPTPSSGEGQVLVRVHASSVNTADLDYLLGRPRMARLQTGRRRPRIRRLGLDVAGRVEAVGPGVTRFRPGDEVFGDMTQHGFGAFAEYVCAADAAFSPKPAEISMEEAATVPQAGVMAVQGLGVGRDIRPGDHVLINGAGGTVGPFAVQVAKAAGAEVTGVDVGAKLDFVRSVGADHVIDFTRDNYKRHRDRYDRILDMAPGSFLRARRTLRAGGTYTLIPATPGQAFRAVFFGRLMSLGARKVAMLPWRPAKAEDMAFLGRLLESGDLRPVIDRTFPLAELPAALDYHESGRNRGKVVITV